MHVLQYVNIFLMDNLVQVNVFYPDAKFTQKVQNTSRLQVTLFMYLIKTNLTHYLLVTCVYFPFNGHI